MDWNARANADVKTVALATQKRESVSANPVGWVASAQTVVPSDSGEWIVRTPANATTVPRVTTSPENANVPLDSSETG